jgi:hypothetical protein
LSHEYLTDERDVGALVQSALENRRRFKRQKKIIVMDLSDFPSFVEKSGQAYEVVD